MLFLRTPGSDDLLNFVATRQRSALRAGGFDHFGLRVPRARWGALRERLRRAGVRITGRRGGAAVYIRDSNG